MSDAKTVDWRRRKDYSVSSVSSGLGTDYPDTGSIRERGRDSKSAAAGVV